MSRMKDSGEFNSITPFYHILGTDQNLYRIYVFVYVRASIYLAK